MGTVELRQIGGDVKPYEDRGRHEGEAVSKGISGTKRRGPRLAFVPLITLTADLARLKALLPLADEWEAADILRILDSEGRGYPALGWLVSKYERLLNPPPGDAAQDASDLMGPS